MKIGEVAKLAGIGIEEPAILVASKFSPGQPWLSYAGFALLLGASLWNVRIGASRSAYLPRSVDDNSRMEKMINGEQTDGRGV